MIGERLATAALALLLGMLAGCQTSAGSGARPVTAPAPLSAELAPGAAPAANTDEAGLWLQFEKLEGSVHASGRVIRDPELVAYVNGIVCRLTPDYCGDIRIYLIRTPDFNASMAANGYMEVWSGLMLRAENEAQLAYVLGHELGHYLQRHSVKRWRQLRDSLDAGTFISIAAGVAGVGYVGPLVQMAMIGGALSFSRDQEREADDMGFALMRRAGYDPAQASRIWAALAEEREAGDEEQPSLFFATHPPTEERIETLRGYAVVAAGGDVGTESHRQAVAGHRVDWLDDEVGRHRYAETLVLLERLQSADPNAGDLYAVRGDVYRLRREDGDDERALAAFAQADADGALTGEFRRSQGLVYWRAGRRAEAAEAFRGYLQSTPDASDGAMIRSYLAELEGA